MSIGNDMCPRCGRYPAGVTHACPDVYTTGTAPSPSPAPTVTIDYQPMILSPAPTVTIDYQPMILAALTRIEALLAELLGRDTKETQT